MKHLVSGLLVQIFALRIFKESELKDFRTFEIIARKLKIISISSRNIVCDYEHTYDWHCGYHIV